MPAPDSPAAFGGIPAIRRAKCGSERHPPRDRAEFLHDRQLDSRSGRVDDADNLTFTAQAVFPDWRCHGHDALHP
jgi:hypothetical protein